MRRVEEIVRGQTPIALSAKASVRDAACLMRDQHVGAVLVLDEASELVGIFTARDVITRVLALSLDPDATRLSEVMTSNPDCLHIGLPATDALRLLRESGHKYVPVAAGKRVVGVVSRWDFHPVEHERLSAESEIWEHI